MDQKERNGNEFRQIDRIALIASSNKACKKHIFVKQ